MARSRAAVATDNEEIIEEEVISTKKRPRIKPDFEDLTQPIESNGPTVNVACKLPNGLILQLYNMERSYEQVLGGGSREVMKAVEIPGQKVVLKGFAYNVGAAPKAMIYGGYAITYGVPKDFFEKWMADNHDSPAVVNNLIFTVGSSDPEDLHAEAVENRETKSGLEPINPKVPMKFGKFTITTRTSE